MAKAAKKKRLRLIDYALFGSVYPKSWPSVFSLGTWVGAIGAIAVTFPPIIFTLPLICMYIGKSGFDKLKNSLPFDYYDDEQTEAVQKVIRTPALAIYSLAQQVLLSSATGLATLILRGVNNAEMLGVAVDNLPFKLAAILITSFGVTLIAEPEAYETRRAISAAIKENSMTTTHTEEDEIEDFVDELYSSSVTTIELAEISVQEITRALKTISTKESRSFARLIQPDGTPLLTPALADQLGIDLSYQSERGELTKAQAIAILAYFFTSPTTKGNEQLAETNPPRPFTTGKKRSTNKSLPTPPIDTTERRISTPYGI